MQRWGVDLFGQDAAKPHLHLGPNGDAHKALQLLSYVNVAVFYGALEGLSELHGEPS